MRIVIPLFDRFTALDAVGPYEVLSRLPGSEVIFAAEVARPVRTDGGRMGIVADAALNEIDHCDILVVPGGPGGARQEPDRLDPTDP
jgi:putative intracellular protease/amidase